MHRRPDEPRRGALGDDRRHLEGADADERRDEILHERGDNRAEGGANDDGDGKVECADPDCELKGCSDRGHCQAGTCR